MADIARHIKIPPNRMLPVVLVVGDPGRVDKLKLLCDSYEDIAYNREYKTVECTYKNQKFLCTSHGVGSAGAAICFNELINLGAKVIIRAGSCGSLQPGEIKQGDICICNAAVREDRVSQMLVPADFPAVADFGVYTELLKSAEARKVKVFTGISLSSDLYYPHTIIPSTLEVYSKANVAVVEMEVATLMVIGTLKKVKTGGIFIVDGCPLKWEEGDINVNLNPEQLNNMLMVSLDTCSNLAAQYTQ